MSVGSSGCPAMMISTPATPAVLPLVPTALSREGRDRQDGAARQAERVVDAVRLGDAAPERRVAVRLVGDDCRLSPSRTTWVLRPAVPLVVGFCGPLPTVGSAWIRETLAFARTGVPLGRNSVNCTDRLSQTATNVVVEPQPNSIVGGRPLFLPEAYFLSTSIAANRASVMPRTSPLSWSAASNRRSSVSFCASPPPNWAVGRPVPTTGSTFHLFDFVIVYSFGLNQQSICSPPSTLR